MSAPTVADMRAVLGLGPEISDAAVVDAYVASLGFGQSAPPAPTSTDPFAMAAAALFRAPGSTAATFVAADQSTTAIRVIRLSTDGIERLGRSPVVTATEVFQLLRVSVAGLSGVADPAGGSIIVDGETFALFGAPTRDIEGVTWTCPAEPA